MRLEYRRKRRRRKLIMCLIIGLETTVTKKQIFSLHNIQDNKTQKVKQHEQGPISNGAEMEH